MIDWHKVEDRLPDVGRPVLLARPDAFGRVPWIVRSAVLYIRHEGVVPSTDAVPDLSTDFWFDADRGGGDRCLVRAGLMWAEIPTPDGGALKDFREQSEIQIWNDAVAACRAAAWAEVEAMEAEAADGMPHPARSVVRAVGSLHRGDDEPMIGRDYE